MLPALAGAAAPGIARAIGDLFGGGGAAATAARTAKIAGYSREQLELMVREGRYPEQAAGQRAPAEAIRLARQRLAALGGPPVPPPTGTSPGEILAAAANRGLSAAGAELTGRVSAVTGVASERLAESERQASMFPLGLTPAKLVIAVVVVLALLALLMGARRS